MSVITCTGAAGPAGSSSVLDMFVDRLIRALQYFSCSPLSLGFKPFLLGSLAFFSVTGASSSVFSSSPV